MLSLLYINEYKNTETVALEIVGYMKEIFIYKVKLRHIQIRIANDPEPKNPTAKANSADIDKSFDNSFLAYSGFLNIYSYRAIFRKADAKTVANDVNTKPKSDIFRHLPSRNNIYKNKLADVLNINIHDDAINFAMPTC